MKILLLICFCLRLTQTGFSQSEELYKSVQIKILRQEKYIGCGTDFVGADRRVIFNLTNNNKKTIYIFGTSYDDDFFPTGYILKFNQKT